MRGLNSARFALRGCRHGGLAFSSSFRAAAPRALVQSQSPSSPPALAQGSHRATISIPGHAYTCLRCFSQTTVLGAKKGKDKERGSTKRAAAKKDHNLEEDEEGVDERKKGGKEKATVGTQGEAFNSEAAFDLADVEAEYVKIDERFEKRLQEFKAGGRFNPESLGQLKVKPDRGSAQVYPLRELAQVAHRGGRSVSILVSDAAYIKPIMSAVQNSNEFNQQPQRDPDNDLELVLKIEPENPEEQQKRLRGECNGWKDAVRDVLANRKHKHAGWQKAKHITKDDVKALDKKVKALQDKKLETIERREKQLVVELANRQKRL